MTGQVVAFSYISGVVWTGPKLQCHWLVDCSAHLGKSFHFITGYNNIHWNSTSAQYPKRYRKSSRCGGELRFSLFILRTSIVSVLFRRDPTPRRRVRALSIRPKIPEIPGEGANGTDIFRNFIPRFWGCTSSLRTQTYFRLSLVPPKITAETSDSRNYVCVRWLVYLERLAQKSAGKIPFHSTIPARIQLGDRAEGGAGVGRPLFCKNKNKLNKK